MPFINKSFDFALASPPSPAFCRPLKANAKRRAGRFDVLCADGETVAFAAPTDADMESWLEALRGGTFSSAEDGRAIGAGLGSNGDAASSRSGAATLLAELVPFDIAGDEVDLGIAAAAAQGPRSPAKQLTPQQQAWAAAFGAFVARDGVDGPDLRQPDFVALAKEVLAAQQRAAMGEGETGEGAAGSKQPLELPSESDLEACFVLADDDKSGRVSEREFVRLMALIAAGGVNGLGRGGGWFTGASPQQAHFKAELLAAEASDAKGRARAMSVEAADLAVAAQKAAHRAVAERRKSNAPPMVSAAALAELEWRKKFTVSSGGEGALDRAQFVVLVKKVLVKELMQQAPNARSGEAGGAGAPVVEMPTDKDLDAAFVVADADGSGKVDQDEFVRLMKLIKVGKVEGLGASSYFSFAFGGASAVEKEAQFRAELAAADAAALTAQAADDAAQADDAVSKAEAEAKVAAGRAKAAIASAKAAEDDAAAIESAAQLARNEAKATDGGGGFMSSFSSMSLSMSGAAEEPIAETAAAEAAGGPTATIGGEDDDESGTPALVYASVEALLVQNGLSQFLLPLAAHSVFELSDLKGCTDAWLIERAGMKAAHVAKFKRALRRARLGDNADLAGALGAVAAHDANLAKLQAAKEQTFKLYEVSGRARPVDIFFFLVFFFFSPSLSLSLSLGFLLLFVAHRLTISYLFLESSRQGMP
jgi:hypothetical protein